MPYRVSKALLGTNMLYAFFQRALLLLALLLSSSAGWAASGTYVAMKIHCKSGSDVVILLDDRPKVTFDKNDLVIATQTRVVDYPAAEVLKFTYLDKDELPAHINNVTFSGIVFSFDDNKLLVQHLDPNVAVTVCAVDGKTLASGQSDAQGRVSLPLPEVPGGVYVVKTPSVTFKFRKP